MNCHACASPARDFAHWGWLCADCWDWCLRLVARLCGDDAADRLRARFAIT